MPREKQKRGRRAEEKKRKHDEETEPTENKRQKPSFENVTDESHTVDQPEQDGPNAETADYIPLDDGTNGDEQYLSNGDTVFFGLLDEEEQEYFSKASETLELNQFEDEEERRLFLDSVYTEADGKELKVACSQSCSRLMEKLITLSDTKQRKRLFGKFQGHFLHLVQHRFASHCCETLFTHSAPTVTHELSKKKDKNEKEIKGDNGEENEGDEVSMNKPMADLFLGAVSELEGNLGYLLTERFASHTLRVLLLILAGEPLDKPSNASIMASRKKEKVGSLKPAGETDSLVSQARPVPHSFTTALEKMMKDVVSGLDTTYIRALATHPVGNPVMQVLVSVELTHLGKAKAKDPNSIIRKLIPDDNFEEGSESATFVRGLLYDPVGSRLLETIVRCAPGPFYKKLYRSTIRDRIGSLARNEIAAYVVVQCLDRLSKEDLENAISLIIPELPSLVERSRVVVIRQLVDRGVFRGADLKPLANALESAYDPSPATRLEQVLKLETSEEEPQDRPHSSTSNAEKLHGSLLAQAMLRVSGPLRSLIESSLLASPPATLVKLAKDPTASHVLQEALTQPGSTVQFRRQLAVKFSGHIHELALNSSGSHLVDALWPATKDIIFVKERIAVELAENEQVLRDSFLGRAVWRNWSMDLFKRRKGEWIGRAKGLGEESNDPAYKKANGQAKPKSKIELARERYAAKAENAKQSKGQQPAAASS